jgi:hypothetical protein
MLIKEREREEERIERTEKTEEKTFEKLNIRMLNPLIKPSIPFMKTIERSIEIIWLAREG